MCFTVPPNSQFRSREFTCEWDRLGRAVSFRGGRIRRFSKLGRKGLGFKLSHLHQVGAGLAAVNCRTCGAYNRGAVQFSCNSVANS